jgi:hypothetical protein
MNDKRWTIDTDTSWSDDHIIHVWNWLIKHEDSPWKNAPTMLMTAMGVPKLAQPDMKSNIKKGALFFGVYRRIKVTQGFKKIINGEIIPRIEKRNKLGWVIKYSLFPNPNPTPLPIPAFIKATLTMTKGGLKVTFGSTPILQKPREDRSKLMNPFGV